MSLPSSAAGEKDREDPVAAAYRRGLALLAAGSYFAAHEHLEDAWRAAAPDERDFFQGLIHVAVAWYQAGRRKRVGCERQLAKAARRLARYAPAHRGLDVRDLLDQVEHARVAYPDLPAVCVPPSRDRSRPAGG